MNKALLDANTLIAAFDQSHADQWNDAYLIALAAKHRVKLATLERKLGNMDTPKSPAIHVVA